MKTVLSHINTLLVICSLLLFACQPSYQELSELVFYDNYEIDQESLLQSLDGGDEIPFVLLEKESDLLGRYSPIEIPWTSREYRFVLESIYELVWSESIGAWHINELRYSVRCETIDIGFEAVTIGLFQDQSERRRTRRVVIIQPQRNLIHVTEIEVFSANTRVLLEQPFLDEKTISIFAEDALKIADVFAGKQYREQVGDRCEIVVSYIPEVESWRVNYGIGPKILINALTGHSELVE